MQTRAQAWQPLLNKAGKLLARDHMSGPQYIRASEEIQYEVLAESPLACGKPCRWRAAEQSSPLTAPLVVRYLSIEIAEDLLKANAIEFRFVTLASCCDRRPSSLFQNPLK
jgi:hypothetical protein